MRKPTDSELEILQLLWKNGPQSVRQIHEALSKKKNTFYTTTLKTMQVMTEKGLLTRDTSSRSHVYTAHVLKKEVENNIVRRIKDSVFGGSTGQLILSAIGQDIPSHEELVAIKELIDKIEKRKEDGMA